MAPQNMLLIGNGWRKTMPYIKKDDRVKFSRAFADLFPETPGELNYIFTEIIFNYLEQKGQSYQTYNDIIGALECCKMELYRRHISTYEDKKIQENGDL